MTSKEGVHVIAKTHVIVLLLVIHNEQSNNFPYCVVMLPSVIHYH